MSGNASTSPRVSVIVSTNGRCASLANLLACLRFQKFSDFELCLVCGPRDDGTRDLARSWQAAGDIKLGFCDEANLARSRNAGLAIAAGEYVAFIDDDALPEPAWLAQLVEALTSGDAVGAGGLVFEPNGRLLQFRYSSCDRFGRSTHGLREPADPGAFPFSASFPHFMGANCMFRRDAVVALGGFDEEYQYYLEETDLCCRLVDEGHQLRQLDRAPVYHKFLSGTVRDAAGITIRSYPTLKSQLYFSLRHARGHASLLEILDVAQGFMAQHRATLETHASAGRIHQSTLEQFDADVERAWQDGLTRGLADTPRLRPPAFFARPEPFRPFPRAPGVAQGRHLVFVLDGRPVASDFDRRTAGRAVQLAAEGNLVRLLAVAETAETGPEETVEFEDGVWKHWLAPAFPRDPPSPLIVTVTEKFWSRAVAIYGALDRISAFASIDVVEDCSDVGLALAVALQSSLRLRLHIGSEQAHRVLVDQGLRSPLQVVASRAAAVGSAGEFSPQSEEPVIGRPAP